MNTGTFKIKVTGRTRSQGQAHPVDHRHVPPRQLPQLRLLHQLREPRPGGRARRRPSARASRHELRGQLPHARARQELPRDPVRDRRRDQRPAAHQRREPLICGTPTFGRTKNQDGTPRRQDRHGRGQRRRHRATSPTRATALRGQPDDQHSPTGRVQDQVRAARPAREQHTARGIASQLQQPLRRQDLIRLRDNVMDITTANGTKTTGVAWPTSGVVYVANRRLLRRRDPDVADYDEPIDLRQRLRQRHLLAR